MSVIASRVSEPKIDSGGAVTSITQGQTISQVAFLCFAKSISLSTKESREALYRKNGFRDDNQTRILSKACWNIYLKKQKQNVCPTETRQL